MTYSRMAFATRDTVPAALRAARLRRAAPAAHDFHFCLNTK
jgi:hypothetical protein